MESIQQACDKEQYSTYQDVIRAMDGLAKRGKTKLRSYSCDFCGKFHITSIKSGRKKGNWSKDKKFNSKMTFFKKHSNPVRIIKVTQAEIDRGRQQQSAKPITDMFIKLQFFIFKNK